MQLWETITKMPFFCCCEKDRSYFFCSCGTQGGDRGRFSAVARKIGAIFLQLWNTRGRSGPFFCCCEKDRSYFFAVVEHKGEIEAVFLLLRERSELFFCSCGTQGGDRGRFSAVLGDKGEIEAVFLLLCGTSGLFFCRCGRHGEDRGRFSAVGGNIAVTFLLFSTFFLLSLPPSSPPLSSYLSLTPAGKQNVRM